MSSRSKFLVVTSSSCLVLLLLLGAVKGRSAEPGDAYKHLMVFTEVLSRIKNDYVEEPDVKSVTLGALNGMLESVDPFASYLSADQYKLFQKNRDTLKGETGLVLSRRYGYVGIVDVVPGSPAAKAGLNTNDMLETINGIGTRDMPLAFAELTLRGEPGTKVEISALKVAHPEPQKMTLTRAVLKYPAVTSRMLEDQIGYVQVPVLEAGRVKEVTSAVSDLQRQGAKRMILDLRNNAVGTPEEGIALANLFVDNGTLATLQGQKVAKQTFNADSGKALWRGPLTVITNRGTADGAEVAANALLDNKRGEVVGEKSYGFAGVRKAITLDDGSAVILTVAKYMNAAGKAIQDVGVTPSVPVVEVDAAVADADDPDLPPTAQPKKPASTEDVLLKRAIEVTKKGTSTPSTAGAAAKSDTPGKDTRDPKLGPLNLPSGTAKEQ